MLEVRIEVTGRVQGVFFRAHVKKCADQLGFKGFVQNLSNGNVEIRMLGNQKEGERLMKLVQESPGLARIESFTLDEHSLKEPYSSFEVKNQI